MLQTFGQINALVEVALFVLLICFAPALLLYVLVRIVRDVRRIAVALEVLSGEMSETGTPAPAPRPLPVDRQPSRIANSMFGR